MKKEYKTLSTEEMYKIIIDDEFGESFEVESECEHSYRMLVPYFELEIWSKKQGLMLLSSIDPHGAIIEFEDEICGGMMAKGIIIMHAHIFDTASNTFDYPSKYWLDMEKEELKFELDSIKKEGKYKDKKLNFKKQIDKIDELLDSQEFNKIWNLYPKYSSKLSRIYWLWDGSDHPKGKLKKEYFINWAIEKQINVSWLNWAKRMGFLRLCDEYENHNKNKLLSNSLTDHEQHSDDLINAFDPVTIQVIANMFMLDKDPDKNFTKWKIYAEKASANGLISARVSTGRGSAMSTFNPWLVGEWIIKKNKGLTQEQINRKLANNLPDRSIDFKDFILQ